MSILKTEQYGGSTEYTYGVHIGIGEAGQYGAQSTSRQVSIYPVFGLAHGRGATTTYIPASTTPYSSEKPRARKGQRRHRPQLLGTDTYIYTYMHAI